MKGAIPKSSSDALGKILAHWRNRRVAKEVSEPFLDVACGNNLLASSFRRGIGVDVMNYGNADLILDDFAKLPFRAQTFNSISIVASLNYFEHPKGVLVECARVLKEEGSLILTLLPPIVGKIWHSVREPWARQPGCSAEGLRTLLVDTGLHIAKKTKFMIGINNLYVLRKL